jgi:hypothetical protein
MQVVGVVSIPSPGLAESGAPKTRAAVQETPSKDKPESDPESTRQDRRRLSSTLQLQFC